MHLPILYDASHTGCDVHLLHTGQLLAESHDVNSHKLLISGVNQELKILACIEPSMIFLILLYSE